jgi:hypothetical protein
VDEIDETTDIELLQGHLCRLPGEPEEPSEWRDVHLVVEIDRLEGSVSGRDTERDTGIETARSRGLSRC